MRLEVKKPSKKFIRMLPMRVLRLEPDDVIVLQTDLLLDKDQCQALRDRASEQFPGFKVAIITSGLKIGVLRKTKR
jgi:hypothetical protein